MSTLPPEPFAPALEPQSRPASAPMAMAVKRAPRALRLLAADWLSQARAGRLMGLITGCWLTLYCLVDFMLRPRSQFFVQAFETFRDPGPVLGRALLAVMLLGAAPCIVAAVWTGIDFRRSRSLFSIALLVSLSITLSYVEVIDVKGLNHLLLVVTIFSYLLVGISANINPEEFLKGMGLSIVVTQTAMMLLVLVDHDVQWGRLYGHNSPNYWGMSAQATIIACLAIRSRPLQVIAVAVSLITMVWCQSRGSMLATGVGLVVALTLLSMTKRLSAWIWLAGPAIMVPIGIFGMGYFSDKILRLSDPARGSGSGFTGRVSAWRETLDLFYGHPLFGVGYRNHEQYLTSAVSAHNAYLATLADVGLFGVLAYLVLVLGGMLVAAAKAYRAPTPGRLMAVAYLSAYLINGLFERNALNTGNFYSVMAIVACAWSWRIDNPGVVITRPLGQRSAMLPRLNWR